MSFVVSLDAGNQFAGDVVYDLLPDDEPARAFSRASTPHFSGKDRRLRQIIRAVTLCWDRPFV
jgi:hypothetical protein